MRHIKRYNQLFENTQELTQEQKDWLDQCTDGTWEINQQTGLVDVDGIFNCQRQGLTDFKGVRFGEVSKNFDCSGNQLTSLKGGPQKVGRDFLCYSNPLTSLEGAPLSVGGYLFCYDNPISENTITNVIRRMSDRNVSLEQAVSSRWKTGEWDEIPEEDKPYLAKHNPDLTPEEKSEYAALARLKRRVI